MSTTVYSDLRRFKKIGGQWIFGGASNFSNLLAPWASGSRSLMLSAVSHTPPLLLGTLFLSRSALLTVSLLSDPELKLTFSVLSTNCLNFSVFICVPVLLDEWVFL